MGWIEIKRDGEIVFRSHKRIGESDFYIDKDGQEVIERSPQDILNTIYDLPEEGPETSGNGE